MSAQTSCDPLVVNTRDGVVWQRRAVTAEGRGLYAVTGSCSCPEFLMATLAELAAHGIAGAADVLPMPVGSQALKRERDGLLARYERVLNSFSVAPEAAAAAVMAVRDHEAEWLLREAQRLQDRVSELEAERHSTNEALDTAVQELRRRDTPTAPYTATPETHASMRAALARHYSNARHGACENCGAAPEDWCPDCAACEQGCFGGFDGNNCAHSNAKWGGV